MSIRIEIERKIQKKRSEIEGWKRDISAAESFIGGLQEALKLAPADAGTVAVELRTGTDLDKVRNILREAAKPLHIDEIIPKMGKTFTDGMKVGLAGSLGSYAKKRKVFTKTTQKTFGLIEFDAPKNVSALKEAVND